MKKTSGAAETQMFCVVGAAGVWREANETLLCCTKLCESLQQTFFFFYISVHFPLSKSLSRDFMRVTFIHRKVFFQSFRVSFLSTRSFWGWTAALIGLFKHRQQACQCVPLWRSDVVLLPGDPNVTRLTNTPVTAHVCFHKAFWNHVSTRRHTNRVLRGRWDLTGRVIWRFLPKEYSLFHQFIDPPWGSHSKVNLTRWKPTYSVCVCVLSILLILHHASPFLLGYPS